MTNEQAQLKLLKDIRQAGYTLIPNSEGWIVKNEHGEVTNHSNDTDMLDMIDDVNDVQAWVETQ